MDESTNAGLPADIASEIAPAPSAPRPSGGYEFSESQNVVFRGLAQAMSFVGLFYLVGGGILGLAAIVTLAGGAPASALSGGVQAAFLLPVGLWTRRAARAASAITTSQGNDVDHLMAAMEELRRVYGLQRALLVGLFAVILLAFVAGILFAAR
jgi:hypothetical protein